MIRRTAALLAMLSFALAWIVGVWCGHAPAVRLQSALIGLAAGGFAGAGIGVALQKIVLARLAERWGEIESAPARLEAAEDARGAKPARGTSRAATPETTPSATASSATPAPVAATRELRETAEVAR